MGATLRLAGVVKESIVDGHGLRFVVFCQGCPHHCPGCHNPQTHDFNGGYDIDTDRIIEEIRKNPLLQGVTFSGGEPFSQPEAFLELAKQIKSIKGMKLDITAFSGYTYEQLQKRAETEPAVEKLLSLCDYLIDGPFILSERDLNLKYRGSRNQRYLDLNRSRVEGHPVEVPEHPDTKRKIFRPSGYSGS